jgi:hypothetical protein
MAFQKKKAILNNILLYNNLGQTLFHKFFLKVSTFYYYRFLLKTFSKNS